MTRVVSLNELDLAQWIRPGDGIVIAQGTGEPVNLTWRLVEQRAAYTGARLFLGAGFSTTFQPEQADHLRFTGMGGIGALRKLASSGAMDPIPAHNSAIDDLLRDGDIPCDVVLMQVSPADECGLHSFSLNYDYMRSAMRRARVVIAEVNAQAPWTPCDEPLRAEEFTVMVPTDTPPIELPTARFGEIERRIAAHIEPLIPEQATLQVGIGAIPEAIIATLTGRRDLGIHSGMIGDSTVDLIRSGAVSNAHKGLDPGVSITGLLFGSRKLYDFAHKNPALRLCPGRYTHHLFTLAKLRKLVSFNSALEVDLTGQVNAEAIGREHIGGIGGQVDFVRAAVLSGGVSLIALGSAGRGGDSKIVSRLSGPVTTARGDVDVIVTEHGAARLRGKGLRERVRAMVAIAPPEHRERLLREARETWPEV